MAGNSRVFLTWLMAVGAIAVFGIGIWIHPQVIGLTSSLVAYARGGLAGPLAPPANSVVLSLDTGAQVNSIPPSPSPELPTATAIPPREPEATAPPVVTEAAAPLESTPAAYSVTTSEAESTDLATPTALPSVKGVLPWKGGGIPILMYHYIRINPVASDRAGFNLSVTPVDFALQMRLLAESGFHTVTMAQVRDYLRNGTPLPSKPIALTFDDGYDDAYTAARPILERNHLTATFYIITGFVDRPRYMTWNQIETLDREGMEIGAHTVHHPSLPLLHGALLAFELNQSRADLQSHVGHSVLDFCYPGGQFNQTVVTAVGQAGYLSATTTRSGYVYRGDHLLELPRLRIYGGMTLRQFATLLGEPSTAVLPR